MFTTMLCCLALNPNLTQEQFKEHAKRLSEQRESLYQSTLKRIEGHPVEVQLSVLRTLTPILFG